MSSTKRTLSSQILRRLNSGDRSVGSKVHQLEIDKAVEQVINSLLRPQYFQTLQGGETIPEGCVLCTYDSVAVLSWNGISKSVLPAIPAMLPKNMGVFRIAKAGDPLASDFIPVPAGQMGMVLSQRLMSDLMGQIGYEIRGREVYYTKDVTALSPSVTAVTMQLVLMDLSRYDEYDMLPLNADMEAQVVDTVYKMFAQEPAVPQIIDPSSDSK